MYSVSILIRSFLYGAIAVTVDILWGFTGHPLLRTGGLLRHRCLRAWPHRDAIRFHRAHRHRRDDRRTAAAVTAWLVAWLGFGPKVSPLYISVITLVLSVIFVQVIYSGGDFTGSSSGLSSFDTFDISMEGWFGSPAPFWSP